MVQGTRSCIACHFFRSRIGIGFLVGHDGMLMMVKFLSGPSCVTRSSCDLKLKKHHPLCGEWVNPHVSFVYNNIYVSKIFILCLSSKTKPLIASFVFHWLTFKLWFQRIWCLSEKRICKETLVGCFISRLRIHWICVGLLHKRVCGDLFQYGLLKSYITRVISYDRKIIWSGQHHGDLDIFLAQVILGCTRGRKIDVWSARVAQGFTTARWRWKTKKNILVTSTQRDNGYQRYQG